MRNRLAATVLVVALVGVSGFFMLTGPTQGFSAASPGGNTSGVFGFMFSAVSCNAISHDYCIENENTWQDATAFAELNYDSMKYIDERSGSRVVKPGYELSYDCLGSDMWIQEGTSGPDVSYSSSGVSAPYQRIDDEGSIDVRDYDLSDGFRLICADFQELNGEWAGTAVWNTWSSSYVEAEDSDSDGVPDLNDECPSTPGSEETNGCPDSDGDGVRDSRDEFPNDAECVEDSDGDGVCDSKDEYPNDPECVEDSDGDGVCDSKDAFPNDPDRSATQDSDNDGVIDSEDELPNVPGSQSDGTPTLDEKAVHWIGDMFGWESWSNWIQGENLL